MHALQPAHVAKGVIKFNGDRTDERARRNADAEGESAFMVGQKKRLIPSAEKEIILKRDLGPDVHALIIIARMEGVGGDGPSQTLAFHDIGGDSKLKEEREAPGLHLDIGGYLVVRTLLCRIDSDEGARIPAVQLHVGPEI